MKKDLILLIENGTNEDNSIKYNTKSFNVKESSTLDEIYKTGKGIANIISDPVTIQLRESKKLEEEEGIKLYTIRFINSETEEVISTQELSYGSTPTTPDIPNGLDGWDDIIEPVESDKDYFAIKIPYPNDLNVFDFILEDDNSYTAIIKPFETLPSKLIVPFKYEDRPVTKVSSFYSTSDKSNVTEIYIPNTIIELGEYCFDNFTNLTSATIPNSVKSIGKRCFAYCEGLTSIRLSKNLNYIGDSCFGSCTSLTSITIPASVVNIDDYCFGNCQSLETINISNGIERIGENCFGSCRSLSSITLPNTLHEMGDYCFGGCGELCSITVLSDISIANQSFNDCYKLTYAKLGDTKHALNNQKEDLFESCSTYIKTIDVYTLNGLSDDINNAPWGATNADINYNKVSK